MSATSRARRGVCMSSDIWVAGLLEARSHRSRLMRARSGPGQSSNADSKKGFKPQPVRLSKRVLARAAASGSAKIGSAAI
jgi:hypothetical protein